MIGAQSLLKASQAVRSVVPARFSHVITGPPKNKVSKAEFFVIFSIFAISNFAYPTWVLHSLAQKKRQQ